MTTTVSIDLVSACVGSEAAPSVDGVCPELPTALTTRSPDQDTVLAFQTAFAQPRTVDADRELELMKAVALNLAPPGTEVVVETRAQPQAEASVPVPPPQAEASMSVPPPLPVQIERTIVVGTEVAAAATSTAQVLETFAAQMPPEAVAARPIVPEHAEAKFVQPEQAVPEKETRETVRRAEVSADALVAAGIVPLAAPRVEVPVAVQEPVHVTPVEVAQVARTTPAAADVLVQAADAVVDTLLVTPGLLRGQGEVVIQLRPDVLDGTEVKIAVTGRQLEVVFQPQTVDMAVLIENRRPQLMQHLAAKITAFNVSVDVRKKRT